MLYQIESRRICRTLFHFLISVDTLSRMTLWHSPAPARASNPRVFSSILLACLIIWALVCLFPSESGADSLAVGQVRSYSTIHSIGVEWDIVGDTDHDAAGTIQYRVQGTVAWKPGFPLFRVDYTNPDGEFFNMFAGSLLFLNQGTVYEVKVDIVDPDGGTGSQTLLVSTRTIPTLPANGRTLHVAPGTGSGNGTAGNPYKGIAAAQTVAQPGDIFLLHAGNYGGRITFSKSGAAGNYIAWKSAGDGDVSFNGILVNANHIWLEGITVNNQANALTTSNAPVDVVVARSTFTNNHYGIYLDGGDRIGISPTMSLSATMFPRMEASQARESNCQKQVGMWSHTTVFPDLPTASRTPTRTSTSTGMIFLTRRMTGLSQTMGTRTSGSGAIAFTMPCITESASKI